MRRRAIIAATALLTLISLPAATAAAPSAPPTASPAAKVGVGPGLGDSKAPIDISAEGTDIQQADRQVVYYGNVEAIQGTARLNTPKLTVFYVAHAGPAGAPPPNNAVAGSNSVEKIECEGPVYYTTPTQNAKGDHALYIAADDTITMTGNVVLVQDKNVSTGDKLVIEQKTGHSVLTTVGAKTDPSKRVRAVLYPNQNPPAAGGPTSPAAPKPVAAKPHA